jgi:cyanophycin synthetase
VRLIEIRLLEGPNVYRLMPVVKVEVAVGRSRAWAGSRAGSGAALVDIGRSVPSHSWPDPVTDLVAWTRRLRADHEERAGPIAVHPGTDAGHWVITWPWAGAGRSRAIAEAAVDLASREVSPARRVRLTGTQTRLVATWSGRIAAATTAAPSWVQDGQRRQPVVSITGTNGKSTVTRLITHILLVAGWHVGTTTSDGIMVDERLVEAGDWTGPGGAAAILGRDDVDVAVLETARGGLVLRGMGYESNDASVFTNVSSDHLDLQGIHTLPQLTEVKSTVCRITRRDGWAVLNADDPLVASVARRLRCRVGWFSMAADGSRTVARARRTGGRAWVLRDGALWELDGPDDHHLVDIADLPVALGGLARHNIANALAAAGGARALGATREQVGAGLRDFRLSPELSPGRGNLFRLGRRTVIVDFAHNEAGTEAILEVARGLADRDDVAAPVTVIIGTAGDRPDDTIRGIGRIAAGLADRVVIKETLNYTRGRPREEVVALLRAGVAEASPATGEHRSSDGVAAVQPTETAALGAVLDEPDGPGVVVLFCHEERDAVFALLAARGATPLELAGRP